MGGGVPNTLYLNAHSIKLPPHLYLYTHILVQLLVFIKEASWYRRCLTQDLTAGPCKT